MFRIKLAYQSHVETVVLLINQNPRPKYTVSIGIDADEYRKNKTGKNNWLGVLENCHSEKEEAIKDAFKHFKMVWGGHLLSSVSRLWENRFCDGLPRFDERLGFWKKCWTRSNKFASSIRENSELEVSSLRIWMAKPDQAWPFISAMMTLPIHYFL